MVRLQPVPDIIAFERIAAQQSDQWGAPQLQAFDDLRTLATDTTISHWSHTNSTISSRYNYDLVRR
jgi:hypothetical protein